MSTVFSISSHRVLQYFPEVVMHEQTGCAHFSAFAVAIPFLLASHDDNDPKRMLNLGKERFCPKADTFQFWPQRNNRRYLNEAYK